MQSINPFTQRLHSDYTPHTSSDIELFLSQSQAVFSTWSRDLTLRIEVFLRLRDALAVRRDELAHISVEEMWMLLSDARSDIDKTIANIEYFCETIATFLAPEKRKNGDIVLTPKGIVFIIAPWNFPFNQALRNTIPQLLAGNTVMLKHAGNLPRISLVLQELFDAAWFPSGVFRSLLISWSACDALIRDPRIVGVAITSGEKAGRAVGRTAGECLKPSVLELGGNDPCIILPDARIEEAVKVVVKGRMSNGGQKCNAIKRLIIIGERPDLIEALKVAFEAFIPGDPLDPTTTLPPLVNADSVAEIAHVVETALSQGARCITGGEMLTLGDVTRPQFFMPTLLTDVSRDNIAYDTEFFWPVLTIHTVATLEDAIDRANDSRFWLGAVVVGHDETVFQTCVTCLQCGNVSLNMPVTSYPDLPYGGIRESWYGHELGIEGVQAFLTRKVVTRK